jgi:hypothetical protein
MCAAAADGTVPITRLPQRWSILGSAWRAAGGTGGREAGDPN